MSARAYFIGGPLDGQRLLFPNSPPNHYEHEARQEELPVGNPPPPQKFAYEKHFFIDDHDSKTAHVYFPVGKSASAILDMLEARLKEEARDGV